MILISGASRGIGKALREHYLATGEEVLGTARQPRDGLLALDIADPASIDALARQLAGTPISLLVCNAGIYPDKRMGLETGFDAATWAEVFAVNATGPFLLIRALLDNLTLAAPSKVAIISSVMGSSSRASGGSYAYRASKAAAVNIGRSLAVDLRPRQIAVGLYHPGWVKTDMTAGDPADVEPEDSARGLAQRFAALDLATSGTFETWRGAAVPF